MFVTNSKGREENESGSGRDDKVQEATEEGVDKTKDSRVGEKYC